MTKQKKADKLTSRLWLLDDQVAEGIAGKLTGEDITKICDAILAHKSEAHRDLCRQLYNMTAKTRLLYLEKHKEPPEEPQCPIPTGPKLA